MAGGESRQRENAPAQAASPDRYRRTFDNLGIAVWEHDFTILAAAIADLKTAGVTDFRRYIAEHPEFVSAMKQQVPITDVNETALQLFGMPSQEIFSKRLHEMLDPREESFAQGILAIADGSPTFVAESRVRHASGAMIPVFLTIKFPSDGSYRGVSVSLFDARVRLDAERRLELMRVELEQATQAAALAELSASIAHEITQPLSAVLSHARTTRQWLAGDSPNLEEASAALDELTGAAQYTSEVIKRVRSLLAYAKPNKTVVKIDEVIQAAVQLVRRALPLDDAVILQDLQAPDALVLGDAVLLQQTIVNLLNNGFQAVRLVDDRERLITVSTRADDRAVTITVADAGPGFTNEALQQLFKSFYSTKVRGMGLGLSIARTTVRAHEGEIAIANGGVHGGARVTIRLGRLTDEIVGAQNRPQLGQ